MIQDLFSHPSKAAAFIQSKGVLTYEDYFAAIYATAGELKKAGIKEGDRVAILPANGFEYPVLIFAIILLRAIVVPVSSRMPVPQIIKLLEYTACSFFVLPAIHNFGKIENVTILSMQKIIKQKGDVREEFAPLEEAQEATIIFSSGTTSMPKGVLHTLGNHYYNALGSNENIPFGEGDRWLLSLPLYHVGGLSILFRALLDKGSIVLADMKKSFTEMVEKFELTHLSVVPTQLYRIMQEGKSLEAAKRLRAILVGGSEANDLLIQQAFDAGLRIYTTYGLTEMASQVTTTSAGASLEDLKTSGFVLPYREIMIAEDQEILVKGRTLFKEYLHQKEVRDSDGWFATNDLGKIDDEGRLHFLGRKTNMFISGGENIYPEEIENEISQILKIINVVVVPIPHEEFGQRPVAFIDWSRSSKFKEGEVSKLKETLQQNLPKYKVPDYIFPWPDLSAQEQMKINRKWFQNLAIEKVRSNTNYVK